MKQQAHIARLTWRASSASPCAASSRKTATMSALRRRRSLGSTATAGPPRRAARLRDWTAWMASVLRYRPRCVGLRFLLRSRIVMVTAAALLRRAPPPVGIRRSVEQAGEESIAAPQGALASAYARVEWIVAWDCDCFVWVQNFTFQNSDVLSCRGYKFGHLFTCQFVSSSSSFDYS